MAPITGFSTAATPTMTHQAHERLERLHRQAAYDAVAAAGRKRRLAHVLRALAARLDTAAPTIESRAAARRPTRSMEVPA